MKSSVHLYLDAIILVFAIHSPTEVCYAFETQNLGQFRFDLVESTGGHVRDLTISSISDSGAIAYMAYHRDGSSAIYFPTEVPFGKNCLRPTVRLQRSFDAIFISIDMNNNHEIAFSTHYLTNKPSSVVWRFHREGQR